MITFVSEEQRYSSSSTWSVVIGEFHKRKQCVPIVLLKTISTAPEFDLSVQFVCHLLDVNQK